MRLQTMLTVNFYVAYAGSFQCKIMKAECFKPTIRKEIFRNTS